MAGRRHRDRDREPPELNITSFMNLMVVLVPFLLISAVFSQITILQLNLPSTAAASKANKKQIRIEVVVRQNRIEVGDGNKLIKRIRNNEEGYLKRPYYENGVRAGNWWTENHGRNDDLWDPEGATLLRPR